MKGLFSPGNKFGRAIIVIGYMVLMSCMWLICSLPIITIGAANAALYDMMRKILREEEQSVIVSYFRSVKSNFKQATPIGLIVTVVAAVIAFNALLLLGMDNTSIGAKVMVVVYVLVVACFFSWAQIAFAYVARFEDKAKVAMKNTVLMCILHPLTLLRLVVQAALVAYLMIRFPFLPYLPLVLGFLPSGYCIVLVDPIEKMFAKHIPPEENG